MSDENFNWFSLPHSFICIKSSYRNKSKFKSIIIVMVMMLVGVYYWKIKTQAEWIKDRFLFCMENNILCTEYPMFHVIRYNIMLMIFYMFKWLQGIYVFENRTEHKLHIWIIKNILHIKVSYYNPSSTLS